MANNRPPAPDQSFLSTERLFRRVHEANMRADSTATPLAFELPDMSVNREQCGTEEQARKGFDQTDWAVVAFAVADIPPRKEWVHVTQTYKLVPRHVPIPGNFAHAEVRIWRERDNEWILLTHRGSKDFEDNDPDRLEPCGAVEALLDPAFHLRWRKHISRVARRVTPAPQAGA